MVTDFASNFQRLTSNFQNKMSRTFYTERDIEDLAKRGVHELEVNDSVYITDLAREKMDQLGIKAKAALSKSAASTPASSAPSSATPSPKPAASNGPLSEAEKQQVIEKVKNGVIARLGPGVDVAMVDTLVRRVVGQL